MASLNIRKYDLTLLAFVSAVVVFGSFMVFSSSAIMADVRWASPYMFFLKQMLWVLIGFAAMFTTAFLINYRFYQKYAILIYLTALILVILVLFFGSTKGGATRWLYIGSFSFQPSELAKIAVIIVIADFIARKKQIINEFKGLVAPFVYVFLMLIPVALEPDLGTPVLIAVVCLAMLYHAGIKFQAVAAAAGLGIFVLVIEIIRKPYRFARVRDYLDSFVNIDAASYQIKQSLYALGSGGFFGKGLGKSELKLMYLPEAHTDFIFPIIGEEVGFLGALVVMIFFIYIFSKGMRISKDAPDDFSSYLALGITLLIVFQAIINISVATGFFPAKGLPLPFISFGGTSLVISMAMMGILINLSQYSKK